MRRRLQMPVVVLGAVLAGCGDAQPLSERQAEDDSYVVVEMEPADPEVEAWVRRHNEQRDPASEMDDVNDLGGPGEPLRGVAADDAVLFDGPWTVEEGSWSLGPAGVVADLPLELDFLLTVGQDGRSAWISGPALYGRYQLRVERAASAPPVPSWCEDLAEVSLRHDDEQLDMWSFETWADPWPMPRGDLRVRYCASGQDAAAVETADDEFDGDDYRLYSSRHLLQVWAAPHGAPSVLRRGSDFARDRTPVSDD